MKTTMTMKTIEVDNMHKLKVPFENLVNKIYSMTATALMYLSITGWTK